MLMMSPPHCRYICDSALVEKAGPERYQLAIDLAAFLVSLTLHADDSLVGV